MGHLKHLLFLVCCCITIHSYGRHSISADSLSCQRQAPAGIITDHVQSKGQWMVSYRYSNLLMNGNQTGSDKATSDATYIKYMMAPENRSMQMHMVMLAYGVSNRLTLMAVAGYSTASMSMQTLTHTYYNYTQVIDAPMKTSGIADTRMYAMYSLLSKSKHHITATAGISIPTGSIDKTSDIYGAPQVASYCMQPGTGTFALLPSVTYTNKRGKLILGTQVAADIRLGKNAQHYRLGNSYLLHAWASYQVCSFMSASLRAEGISTAGIKGYDRDIAEYRYNDPAADAANYGGKKFTMYAGLNFSLNKPSGLHILVEYGMPAYQYVHGLQMSAQANLLGGIQYAF